MNDSTQKASHLPEIPNIVAMPLIKSGISLQSDMKLGWRP